MSSLLEPDEQSEILVLKQPFENLKTYVTDKYSLQREPLLIIKVQYLSSKAHQHL